jgi:hypothetical protein
MTKTTWKAPDEDTEGKLSTDERKSLPDNAYAFPKQRKMPMPDASHVRNAAARFNQVEDVSDADRKQAWANIEKAAKHFDVDLSDDSWKEAMKTNE